MDTLEILKNLSEKYGWDYCHEYGEPGYNHDGDQKVVLFLSDWKAFENHPRLEAAAEEVASLEWYDEWVIDHENDKCYRSSPDSYSWTASYIWAEDGILTPDDDIETITEYLQNSPGQAMVSTLKSVADLTEAGWTKVPDDDSYYENGWHPGQTDDPKEITAEVRRQFPDSTHDVLFYINGVGQFDTRFTCYTRPIREE
jgi:hypothetical protein